ncbi:hypothetical protein MJ1HA_2076 [Metallosphaera sedula]|nr:hypothetical protein MJ1HA_2076 [Metallosphaera sedula]
MYLIYYLLYLVNFPRISNTIKYFLVTAILPVKFYVNS